jgi:NAD+ dependent glucose-6-phosphate dehydrogenase
MLTDPSPTQQILLTGAAGRIGRAFREHAGDRYRLRLADRDMGGLGEPRGHETFTLDVADQAACRAACADMDVVIHLAADPSPAGDFYGSLLDNNIKATYNIFRAAKDQGCRRVIYASSIRVLEGYPQGAPLPPDLPARPVDMYGVSKCFGEATAHTFAASEGLSGIVVRIGTFDPQWGGRKSNAAGISRIISARDISQLLIRCVETPDIQFAIVHGVSDNRIKRLDIESTRALLGYAPQDDAFEMYQSAPE